MRPATGKTNLCTGIAQVSIRLALDGHSFSVVETSGQDGRPDAAAEAAQHPDAGAAVTVEVVTPRTTLVPAGSMNARDAEFWLAADGKRLPADERAVCSEPIHGCVAVAALPEAALHELRARFGEETRLSFTSPLLPADEPPFPAWTVCRRGACLFVQIHDKGLRLAEAMPSSADEDLCWLVEHLRPLFPSGRYTLILRGAESHRLRKSVGRCFRKVVCV